MTEGAGERRWALAAAVAFGLAVFLAYRNSSLSFGGDAADWIQVSQSPIFGWRFWTYRPWGTSLIYKVLGSNPWAILPFQVVFHGASWLVLAWVLRGRMKTAAGRWIAFLSMLGLGLSIETLIWPFTILSESLCNSLSLVLLAWIVWALPREDGTARFTSAPVLGGLLALAVLWSATRDTNPYTLLLVAGLETAALACPPYRRRVGVARGIVVVAVLACAAVLQVWLARQSTRNAWNYSMTDVVCDRVLTDRDALDYFQAAGMPVSPLLMTFRGKHNAYMANANVEPSDETLRDRAFEEWVRRKGLRTYLAFVAGHPIKAAGWLWTARASLFSPSLRTVGQIGPFLTVYQRENGRRVLVTPLLSRGTIQGETACTRALSDIFFPRWREFWLWALTACAGVWILSGRRPPPLSVLPALLAGVSVMQAAVVGVADTGEIDRHAIHLAFTMRVAFWMAVAVAVDGLARRAKVREFFQRVALAPVWGSPRRQRPREGKAVEPHGAVSPSGENR